MALADSYYHTFLYPASNSYTDDWGPNVTNSRYYDLDPTDIATAVVSYHQHPDGYYVDVSWFTADITAPGYVDCIEWDSSSVCDHWHMILDTDAALSYSEAAQDYVTCQEEGHSVGLQHFTDADSTSDGESCMWIDEDAYDSTSFSNHDRSHINNHYG